MDLTHRFPTAAQPLSDAEIAALAAEAGAAFGSADLAEPVSADRFAQAMAPAGHARVLHVEHVLVAAVWLASVGLGIYRLLM